MQNKATSKSVAQLTREVRGRKMRLLSKIFSLIGLSSKYNKMQRQAKYDAELNFKRTVIQQFILWYRGELPFLYETPSPKDDQKVVIGNEQDNAILTWAKLHQEPIYLESLRLEESVCVFAGKKLLDIGSSAVPSALVFKNTELYCLEPLLPEQLLLGYPFWAYDSRVRFIYGFSERMPFPNRFFDAAISVNALDHVDDFEMTALEIRRVLKEDGLMRFHIHYHPSTATEPLQLSDDRVKAAFSWCPAFRKIAESRERRGIRLNNPNETFTVWSNF